MAEEKDQSSSSMKITGAEGQQAGAGQQQSVHLLLDERELR